MKAKLWLAFRSLVYSTGHTCQMDCGLVCVTFEEEEIRVVIIPWATRFRGRNSVVDDEQNKAGIGTRQAERLP